MPSINVKNDRFYLKKPANAIAYPKGSCVLIKKPHLYSGCVGEVVSVEDKLHLIRIPLKEPVSGITHMHTEAYSDTIESFI